jgi:mono/diheme cytochrome c family protein
MKSPLSSLAGLTPGPTTGRSLKATVVGRGFSRAVILAALLAAAGCRQDMHDTPRYEAYEASASFGDGRASRAAPNGTVARGWLREDDALYTGKVNGELVDTVPFAIGHAELKRGQERFNIYCSPCHGRLGDGNGMVVQRGLRQAASYHNDRLRQERIGYFFDVITNGFGAMQGYAEQVPVRDRWLIASYVRVLQFSQNAPAADVPAERRSELDAPPRQAAEGGTREAPPVKH